MRRLVSWTRRPAAVVAWWGTWWAVRNRSTVAQWARFGAGAARARRPWHDVVAETRVRAAFTARADLRRSAEVEVVSVAGGVAHLRGVPGGADTDRAALAAARVRGVTSVEVQDKVGIVDGTSQAADAANAARG